MHCQVHTKVKMLNSIFCLNLTKMMQFLFILFTVILIKHENPYIKPKPQNGFYWGRCEDPGSLAGLFPFKKVEQILQFGSQTRITSINTWRTSMHSSRMRTARLLTVCLLGLGGASLVAGVHPRGASTGRRVASGTVRPGCTLSPCEQNDIRLWKHYLPHTSVWLSSKNAVVICLTWQSVQQWQLMVQF